MGDYNSIEEFIFINKRYPNALESRQLYESLWNKYLNELNEEQKRIAIENDEMQDYSSGKTGNQKEAIKRIAISAEKLRRLLGDKKGVISINYGERWGIYSIYVTVNCLSRSKLYKFRDRIPSYFEGWEIKLVSLLECVLRWQPIFIFGMFLLFVLLFFLYIVHNGRF